MKNLRLLLYPFALLYGIVAFIRNVLFDAGILRSKSYPVWVISVGNLSVGGTGKSPHVEYLIRLLGSISSKYANLHFTPSKTAVLSRGYGRRSSGFRIVTTGSSAEEAGDEPVQIKGKFQDVNVAVDEKRTRGIAKLLETKKDINLFLLDDSFQHRYVTPTVSILLTNYHKPFYEDHLLPAGTLREQRRGYRRADIIIVTRTPENLTDVEKKMTIKKINPLPNQNIFFSSIVYDPPIAVYGNSSANPKIQKDTSVVLLTGIANANDLKKYLQAGAKEVVHEEYRDHHQFTLVEIMKIKDIFNRMENPNKIIITTEKDSVRLHQSAIAEQLSGLPVFYIPVRVKMHDEAGFEELIIRYLNSFQLYKPLQRTV